MKFLLGFLFLWLGSFCVWAQLEISSGSNGENRSEKLVNTASQNAVLFSANWSSTDRILSSNGDLFGEALGEREKEGGLNTWSFGVAVRGRLKHQFFWEGGMSYLRNGESYKYSNAATDSSFSYRTTYAYIGMPLKINYRFGDLFSVCPGAGVLPQLFSGYKQDQQWSTPENGSSSLEVSKKSGYNTFVFSVLALLSFELTVHKNWQVYVAPEARWQLNSSYGTQDAYVHKARAYGLSFGLIRNL